MLVIVQNSNWQRRQEKAAEKFNAAKEIALKKIIDENFGGDPDDPKSKKFNNKGIALLVSGVLLLDQVQNELKRMQEQLTVEKASVDKSIAEIDAKEQAGAKLSEEEIKNRESLNSKLSQLSLDQQAILDAQTHNNELIEKEKAAEAIKNANYSNQDNTTFKMPIDRSKIAPKKK